MVEENFSELRTKTGLQIGSLQIAKSGKRGVQDINLDIHSRKSINKEVIKKILKLPVGNTTCLKESGFSAT